MLTHLDGRDANIAIHRLPYSLFPRLSGEPRTLTHRGMLTQQEGDRIVTRVPDCSSSAASAGTEITEVPPLTSVVAAVSTPSNMSSHRIPGVPQPSGVAMEASLVAAYC